MCIVTKTGVADDKCAIIYIHVYIYIYEAPYSGPLPISRNLHIRR
jgi:hypothetical protein